MEVMHGLKAGENTVFLPVQVDDQGRVVVSDAPLASIVDNTSTAGFSYLCEAAPGSPVGAAVWRIARLTTATGVLQWADGNAEFVHVAAARATLSYF